VNKLKDFKNHIRLKLIKFLGIDNLNDAFNKHLKDNRSTLMKINSNMYTLNRTTKDELKKDISHFQQSVNVLHNTVENVVSIGTDVDYYNGGRSWAVVCIEGKINIVKFVDLSRRNALSILDFLKNFEAGKHCIDTPYKQIFYDGLFKF